MNKCFVCRIQLLAVSINVTLFPANSSHLETAFCTKWVTSLLYFNINLHQKKKKVLRI